MQNRFEPDLSKDWRSNMGAHNRWTKRIKTQLEADKLSIPTIHQDHDELWKYNKSNKQIKQDNVLAGLILLSIIAGIFIGISLAN